MFEVLKSKIYFGNNLFDYSKLLLVHDDFRRRHYGILPMKLIRRPARALDEDVPLDRVFELPNPGVDRDRHTHGSPAPLLG